MVREVPCGTHLGVRTTLASYPANIQVKTLRRPTSLETALGHFKSKGLVTPGYPVPVGRLSVPRLTVEPRHTSLRIGSRRSTAYVRGLGHGIWAIEAAIRYAQWPAAAEYRLLASAGIRVDEISFDLEQYVGRGRMPVLEAVYLSELLDLNKHDLELVAWSQEQDDAVGCDRLALMVSILRQIYHRRHQGRPTATAEMNVAKDLLQGQDTDRDSVCLIARIALLVAPTAGEPEEENRLRLPSSRPSTRPYSKPSWPATSPRTLLAKPLP